MNKKPKVLVIGEAANPEWVSVPLVGWSLANALRDVADVHLVTQIRNSDAIERFGWHEGVEFTAINSEAVMKPLHKLSMALRRGTGKGWTFATAANAVGYPYFEHLVWKQFGEAIKAGEYDIVHRVTPLSPTVASPIAGKVARAGVPFILGPLNGGVPWPEGFDKERRKEREWLSYVRKAYKLNPWSNSTYKHAKVILAGSRHTASEVPTLYQDKVVYLPENAVDPSRFNKVTDQHLDGALRGCFIGRLVPYKGPDMLIEGAAPLMQAGKLTLDIIGDGPMMSELVALTERLGVSNAITFHGNLPHNEVQDVATRSNLLTFPSIREFGGGVVLEAMAMGVVPVIVDYAGPGELVNDRFGYKIPIGTREQITNGLQKRLAQIVADPAKLRSMSKACRTHVHENFTWSAKANQVAAIYDDLLSGRAIKPPLTDDESS